MQIRVLKESTEALVQRILQIKIASRKSKMKRLIHKIVNKYKKIEKFKKSLILLEILKNLGKDKKICKKIRSK